MTTTTHSLEQRALDLIALGYHVFPCKPAGKVPLTSDGFKSATRDERKILHWWERTPDANIGIACEASGISVLDIDSKAGANPREVLEDRDLAGAPLIVTGKADNGIPGAHVYFRGKLRTGPLPIAGCEIRGQGAYVVAPGSIHPSGGQYKGKLPAVHKLPNLPAWVTDLVAERRNGNGITPVVEGKVAKGDQHRTLVSWAGTMRNRGMSAKAIEAALWEENLARLEEPAPRENIRKIAESVAKYPPGQTPIATAANGTHIAGDERFIVTKTDKGKLKLPAAADRGDVSGHCAWLTSVFALDPEHPIIKGARQGGRGGEGHVALARMDAPTIRFEPASRINTPQKLKEDLTWQTLPTDDATPAFLGEHCNQIAHVIKMLCGVTAAQDAAQETANIIGAYLAVAKVVEGHTSYGSGPDRYAAAAALRREADEDTGKVFGPPRYLVDSNTGELVVPLDELQAVARTYVGGSIARGWLDARLEDLGWQRAVLDGHSVTGGVRRGNAHLRRHVYRGHLPHTPESDS